LPLTLFGLACLAKEAAFAFPLVILLYELFPINKTNSIDKPLPTRIKRGLPYIIIAAGLFAIRWFVLGGLGGYMPEESYERFYTKLLYRIFLQPFIVMLLPANKSLLEPLGTAPIALLYAILLSPLLFLATDGRWRITVFCATAIILCVLPIAHMGICEGRLQSSRFLYIPSIFFSIFLAALFSWQTQGRFRNAAAIITVIYCFTLLLLVHQNNYAWREAGRLVQTAAASSDELVKRHSDEWGVTKQKLFVFNVPKDHLGAHTFFMGLPEMLNLRHGDELDGVNIEAVYGRVQTPENVDKLESAVQSGAVVWFFNSLTWKFVDYEDHKQQDL
jgi:hypothetical protein